MTTLYMFHSGDDPALGGPYAGPAGLDTSALIAQFRQEAYAKAEAKRDDFCWISESDFVAWLVERGTVQPVATTDVHVHVACDGEHRYVPAHWPDCPACAQGRGEEEFGTIRHSLNRQESFYRCTECRHVWGHHEEPYLSHLPMLEDDGREIDGGCVPYAISQAGCLGIDHVLQVCRQHGWREGVGMFEDAGVAAAAECGVEMVVQPLPDAKGALTLAKLLPHLSSAKRYIVATKDHWLAVVAGENRDPAGTHGRSGVLAVWEIRPLPTLRTRDAGMAVVVR